MKSKKKILLLVCGLSPQIVTETLYALAIGRKDSFIPEEVHLVTTSAGAALAKNHLFGRYQEFNNLCEEYQLTGIEFTPDHIHVVKSDSGTPIQDIRTATDNELVADFLIDIIRSLTNDEDCILHVSIAGGRKTMGYYAGYALSLYGRPQDELSHVLVSEEFESLEDFYFPTKESHVIENRQGQSLDIKDAHIDLAYIPFVRLRDGIPPMELIKGDACFSDTVAAAQEVLEPAGQLVIDLDNNQITIKDTTLKMSDADLVFLAWAADRQYEQNLTTPYPPDGIPDIEYSQGYEYFMKCLRGKDESPENNGTLKRLSDDGGMSKKFFDDRLSNLKKKIRKIKPYTWENYMIKKIRGEDGAPNFYAFELRKEMVSMIYTAL